jgi:hypothetical protein
MKPMGMKLPPIFFLAFLLFWGAPIFSAAAVDEVVTISIPDAVLLKAIREGLPIPIEAQSQHIQGDVIIQSLDQVQVREKSLFLQGVVSGQNFTMNTAIMGKEISMNIGTVQLPVTCELFLRFDGTKKLLFITPRFSKPKSLYTANPADALLLLLSSLGEKEYPMELGSIQPILAKAGMRNIFIELEPVDILTQDGLLLIKMKSRLSNES